MTDDEHCNLIIFCTGHVVVIFTGIMLVQSLHFVSFAYIVCVG